MEEDGFGTTIAIQVIRKGLDRITAAAVLEPYKAGDEDAPAASDETDLQTPGPRWTITVYELLDNDQLSNLDSILMQTGPHVALYAAVGENKNKRQSSEEASSTTAAGSDQRKIMHLLERQGIEARPITSNKAFKAGEDFEGDLSRLLGESNLLKYKKELEYNHGMGCIACLVRELGLLQQQQEGGEVTSEWGAYRLQLGSLAQYVRIDSSAAEAVNLFPPEGGEQWTEYGSIYQILNRCKTKMGERLLGRWLRQPLVDPVKIEKRLNIVEQLKDDISLRGALQDSALKNTPDLETLGVRLQRKRAGLMDIYKVYCFAQKLPYFTGALEEATETPLGQRFAHDFDRLREHFTKFTELVECVIDMDSLPDLSINPQHDPALAEIKEELDGVYEEIERLYERSKTGWAAGLGIELRLEMDNKKNMYIFRATKGTDDKKLRSCNERCEIIGILKNGVHFTIPKLKSAAARYQELKAEYNQKQAGLVKKATETALTYLPLIEAAGRLVAELDVLVSLGHVAALAPNGYVRPKLLPSGTGVLKIKNGRHPCLEMQNDVQFIPNDYVMKEGESAFNLVTGPNMGGKSTYIRALGCIAVMAQIGSFVPADEAEISVIDAILARVGAGDAAQRGVSTFMAEMIEASTILQTATSNSLLIIDELGRGTSTFDGFGLAWAISEYIITRLGCFCLFATHFHELTALEQRQKGVKNLHVSALASPGSITMLYEVKPGPCLESYGIHVARMAKFPNDVIEEAKAKAAELENLESKAAFVVPGTDPAGAQPAHKRQKTLSPAASALLKAHPGLQAEGVFKSVARHFLDLPMDTLGDQDALSRLTTIVQEVNLGDQDALSRLTTIVQEAKQQLSA